MTRCGRGQSNAALPFCLSPSPPQLLCSFVHSRDSPFYFSVPVILEARFCQVCHTCAILLEILQGSSCDSACSLIGLRLLLSTYIPLIRIGIPVFPLFAFVFLLLVLV